MADTTTTEAQVADGCMTLEEATAFAGISRAALYRLMASGQLVYVQSGRRRLITRQSLRAWLAARVVTPTT